MLQLRYVQPPNDYPTSDGKPMAETDKHRDQMVELIQTLKSHFQDRPDVYVSGNLLWFYQQGDRRRHLSPDVLVRVGAPPGSRLNYLQWEEGGPPQVIIELTSKTTRREDLGKKFELYERLGVEEYYLFDPLDEYLKPRFRSFHRSGGQLVPRVGATVHSPYLNLELFVQNDKLRLRDVHSGRILSTDSERADAEQERADAEQGRADSEKERADRAQKRADAERERADRAEEELRQLRARLKDL